MGNSWTHAVIGFAISGLLLVFGVCPAWSYTVSMSYMLWLEGSQFVQKRLIYTLQQWRHSLWDFSLGFAGTVLAVLFHYTVNLLTA